MICYSDMYAITENKNFQEDYRQLRNISLDPNRHKAKNSQEHCEMVKLRVLELSKINNLSHEETNLLANLALVHDIGKITGTSSPGASVKMLQRYGIHDDQLQNMVKYHDINLPWYNAFLRGESAREKDWRKLNKKLDIRLLCIFMIADRVDCPGGWRNNQPLVWFLAESRRRDLLEEPIILEDNVSL